MTTSIHHLLGELLLEIFSFFRPESHRKQFIVALIRLSSVCRFWREVITNKADFWTFVDIFFSQNLKLERVKHHLSWIDTQFQRSKSLQIDVRLSLHNLDKSATTEVFNSIVTHAPFHRWRSLIFRGGPFIEVGSSIPYGSFDNLEALGVYTLLPSWLSSSITTTAHKLKKVITKRDSSFPVDYPFISDRVTYFSSYDIDPIRFDVLTKVTHLELRHNRPLFAATEPFTSVTHLYVEVLIPGLITETRFPNVRFIQGRLQQGQGHFPSLRHLVVTNAGKGSPAYLQAPKLETLELKRVDSFLDFRRHMIKQRGGHLQPTTLIFGIHFASLFVVDILRVYNRVHRLHLVFQSNWSSWDVLERNLTSKVEGGWECCPQLAKFEVTLPWGRKEQDPWMGIAKRIFQERKDLEYVRIDWACGYHFTVSRPLLD